MDGKTYTQRREGCRLTAYRDTRGIWTIGFGCTGSDITEGCTWTQAQADAEFARRYADAQRKAALDLGHAWTGLDYIRRCALTDMAYQLGGTGLAEFRHMLLAISQGTWDTAAQACLASLYAEQVPDRARGTAHMLLTGAWPAGFEQGAPPALSEGV